MKRYLEVIGVPGVLVENPHAIGASPRRYAGKKLKANAHEIAEHCDRYEDAAEVILDEPMLRKAIARNTLVLARIILAQSLDEARAIASKPAAKSAGGK